MSCKYDIINEGGRKRVRALRPFTVQGRDVCPMELGGYVYDANTLSQDGNCWIFSGSLEYPGVRVMDEAIVDMGSNLPKATARPKATIISGNSRIMGAISFETQSFDTAQTPAMFEQGAYNVVVGNAPVKANASSQVRIPVPLFAGTVGKVAITSTAYEARLISLNEAGIVTSATTWTVGGPAVILASTAPYILVDVRKVGETAITPADVAAAGVSIQTAMEAQINVFNSAIVPVYNGAVTKDSYILRFLVTGTLAAPTTTNIRNSYVRAECVCSNTNTLAINADFTKINYNMVMTAGVYNYVLGVFRNTNINTPASVNVAGYDKNVFDVSDCPNFEYSSVAFPDLTAMVASGKTFYFKNCNMPVGSAIHYYDPKVNVWDNIDFTKAMADLGKVAVADTVLVSSNVQGMYRIRGVISGDFGMLAEAASSFVSASVSGAAATYDSIIYKDCVIKGIFSIRGRNVFGGTLGGASKITNTTEKAMAIDGNFRIEGNAQVTDTTLEGSGYIGGNAEIKNSVVNGYIYLQDNAKFIPPVVANPPSLRRVLMFGNTQVLKVYSAEGVSMCLEMYDNAVIDSPVNVHAGSLIMRDNSSVFRSDTNNALQIWGAAELRDNARVQGAISIYGDVVLLGNFLLSSGTQTITGKHVISDVSQIAVVNVPPTKTNW
nr:MAG TPA: putative transferase, nesg, ydcK, Structural Genomics.38A [Caudoviricetes sp.]